MCFGHFWSICNKNIQKGVQTSAGLVHGLRFVDYYGIPEDVNIYEAKYELYLLDKNLLQEKLRQWFEEEGNI